jgi:hypothetical protein
MKKGRMLMPHWTTSPLWAYGRALDAGAEVTIIREGRVRGTGYEYIQEAEWMWIAEVEMSVPLHKIEVVEA